MEKKQRRRRIWLVVGALLGATLMTVWLCRPEPTLIDISRVVGPIQIGNQAGNQQWKWLSDEELLVLTSDTGTEADSWQGHAERWNVITGKHIRMAGLTDLLNRQGTVPEGMPRLWALSPNRSWLVWVNFLGGGDVLLPASAHLDGTHWRFWRTPTLDVGFFADDLHWIEQPEEETPATQVIDLQDKKKDQNYRPGAPQAKAIFARYILLHPHFVSVELSPKGGSIDISTYRTEDAQALVASQQGEGRPRNGVIPIQKGTVNLPPETNMVMAEPSPKQETILYYLQTNHINPVLSLLHRVVPTIAKAPIRTESLWISKTDGSGFHEIGHVIVPRSQEKDIAAESNEGEFASVEWLPGGKQVAFVYRHTLYVVPAK